MQQHLQLKSCLEFMGNQRKCFFFVGHDGRRSKLNFSYTLCTLSQLSQDTCNTSNTFFSSTGFIFICVLFVVFYLVLVDVLCVVSISDIIHSHGFLLSAQNRKWYIVALVDTDIRSSVYCQLLSFQTKIKLSNQRRMYCLLTLIV